MKNLVKKIAGSALALILITGVAFAQDSGTSTRTKNQEKNMVKNQSTVGDQNQLNLQYRERFRTSLTQEQKDILQNRQMTQNEKRKAFRACLSEEQKTMLRENQELRKEQKNMFRNNASEEQKQQMRQNRENTRTQTGRQQGKGH
jgi:hypothetical protein